MAPMPVERCSVLYEPGARRHALESEGLGGVKAAALQVHRLYCYSRSIQALARLQRVA